MLFFDQHGPKTSRGYYLISLIFLGVFCLIGEVYAHGWKAPKEAEKLKNPLTADQRSIDSGKDVYGLFCAVCHGETAEGRTKEKAETQTDPPDLKIRLKNHSDGDFFWKVQNGNKDMPSFEEDLEESEIWSVILYLRSLME